MEILTVRELRQLLFEIKDQEANVGMFTEGNRECLPLVSIQDDSTDCGFVSLGFFKESEESKKARLKEKMVDQMAKIKEGVCCSKCGANVTVNEYCSGQSNCCDADVCGEEEF